MHIFDAIHRVVLVYINLDPSIKDVRSKVFYSIDFLQTSLADGIIINCFRDKKKTELGVTD